MSNTTCAIITEENKQKLNVIAKSMNVDPEQLHSAYQALYAKKDITDSTPESELLNKIKAYELSQCATVTYNYGNKKHIYYVRMHEDDSKENIIYNSSGKQVFKSESADRNAIYANLAIKQGRAVIVEHRGSKYVVNRGGKIISVTSKKIMKWGEENGDRKEILDKAKTLFDAKAYEKQELSYEETQSITQSNITVNNVEFYSGGADGSDTFWKEQAKKFGLQVKDYQPQDYDALDTTWKEKIDKAYEETAKYLGRPVLDINREGSKLVRRDMMQAMKADSVFAIGTILQPNEKSVSNPKYSNATDHEVVDGGTGYAVGYAIFQEKPVYVFDQRRNSWTKYNPESKKFETISTPELTPHAATIGTRNLQDNGKQAISEIMQKFADRYGFQSNTQRINNTEQTEDSTKDILEFINQEGDPLQERLDQENKAQQEVKKIQYKAPDLKNINVSAGISTPLQELRQKLTQQQLEDRINMVTVNFLDFIDEEIENAIEQAEEDYNNNKGGENAYKYKQRYKRLLDENTQIKELFDSVGVKTILERFLQTFKDTQSYYTDKPYIHQQYQYLIDYFYTMMDLCTSDIEDRLGVKLIISQNDVRVNDSTQNQEDDAKDSDENDEERVANGNLGWAVKMRLTNPKNTTSRKVKRILGNICRVDSEGNFERDDLRRAKRLPFNYCYATLLTHLSDMVVTPDDFSRKNEDGEYEYPALEKLALKYPWVNQVITELQDNPEALNSKFYYMCKVRIPYWTQKIKEEGELGVQPLNQSLKTEGILDDIKTNYNNGIILSELSVYNHDGSINTENIDKIDEIASEAINFFKTIPNINEEMLEDDNVKDHLEKLTQAFRGIGFIMDIDDLKSRLISDGWYKLHTDISILRSAIKNIKDKKPGVHILDAAEQQYKLLADTIGKVSEYTQPITFRLLGNSYSSYSDPNYIDQMVKYIKSDEHFREWIEREFMSDPFFYDKEKSKFKNYLLQLLSDEKDSYRKKFDYKYIPAIDGVEYNRWTPDMIFKSFMVEYQKSDPNGQYAYYPFPIFSDSEMLCMFKAPKFSDNFKETLLPLYVQIIKQDLETIKRCQERKKKGVSQIQNYDKNGTKICSFPALNSYLDGNFVKQCIEYSKEKNWEELDKLIENAVEWYLNQEVKDHLDKHDIKDLQQLFGHRTIEETIDLIEEFVWNQQYFSMQMEQLVNNNPAFFKKLDGIDHNKRNKQNYASGQRLNTNSQYGKKTQKVIYLKDKIITSRTLSDIEKCLQEAVDGGRLSTFEKYEILSKFQGMNSSDGQAFRTLASTRSILDMLGEWDAEKMDPILDRIKNNKWTKDDFDFIVQTIKSFYYGNRLVDDGLGGKLRVNTQLKDSEFILMAMYNVIMLGYPESNFMSTLNNVMDRYGIDLAVYESGVKLGGQGTIDLNYSKDKLQKRLQEVVDGKSIEDRLKDVIERATGNRPETIGYDEYKQAYDLLLLNKEISQRTYNLALAGIEMNSDELEKVIENAILYDNTKERAKKEGKEFTDTPLESDNRLNSSVVHELPMEGFMIAQRNPEHLFDSQSIIGSQFKNIIISNIDPNMEITIWGKKLKGEEIRRKFQELIIEDQIESFDDLRNLFLNKQSFQQTVLDVVRGNPKYGMDVINALQFVAVSEKGNKDFNIPLNDSELRTFISEIALSMFKNRVTIQHTNGGACTLVANVGYTNDLQVVYDDNGGIKYFEVYMPWSSKKYLQPFLSKKEENGETFWYVDYEKVKDHDPKLLEAFGYRIPTEAKYSMARMKIKGFMPQQNGSTIMLPADTVVYAGEDFDIDKKFLMLPAYKYDKESKKYKVLRGDLSDIESMDRDTRHNAILEIAKEIFSHPTTSEQVAHCGNYDTIKHESRVNEILNNQELLDSWLQKHNLSIESDAIDIYNSIAHTRTDILSKFISDHKKSRSVVSALEWEFNHQKNMAGSSMIGIYANNTTSQAKMQGSGVSTKSDIIINGKNLKSNLSGVIIEEKIWDFEANRYKTIIKRISDNCAEFSAASVDGVKDPVLAELLQTPNTAAFTGYLVRLGMSINQISLLLNSPIVKDYIHKYGEFQNYKSFLDYINNWYLDFTSFAEQIDDPNINKLLIEEDSDFVLRDEIEAEGITDEKLIRGYITGIRIKNGEFESISKKDFFEIGQITNFMSTLLLQSQDFSKIIRNTRQDSPNGAADITIGGLLYQILNIVGLHVDSTDKRFSLDGVDKIIQPNIISNYYASKSTIRNALKNTKIPMTQTGYSLGIESAFQILTPLFPQLSDLMQETLFSIISAKSSTSKQEIEDIFDQYNLYLLSKSKLFGKDENNTYAEKRKYYSTSFAIDLYNWLQNNPEIEELGFFKKLLISKDRIYFNNSSRLEQSDKDRYKRDLLSLLDSENQEVVKKAIEILLYCYYVEGLKFSPKGISKFISSEFKSKIDDYISSLRDMEQESIVSFIKFKDLYLRNNPKNIRKAPDISISSNDEIVLKKPFYNNIGMAYNEFLLHRKPSGINSDLIRYIEYAGSIYRLKNGTIKTYEKIPTFNSDIPYYDHEYKEGDEILPLGNVIESEEGLKTDSEKLDINNNQEQSSESKEYYDPEENLEEKQCKR